MLPLISLVSFAAVSATYTNMRPTKFGLHAKFKDLHLNSFTQPWTAYSCAPYTITLDEIKTAIKTDAVYTKSGFADLGYFISKFPVPRTSVVILISFSVWHDDESNLMNRFEFSLNNVLLKHGQSTTQCHSIAQQGV